MEFFLLKKQAPYNQINAYFNLFINNSNAFRLALILFFSSGESSANVLPSSNSKISSNTNVGHLSYIGDAQLGERVNIGAGTITANYNAITKEKSKTVIEDNVKIGSNSVIVAPTTIKNGANIGAGGIITKDIPAWSLGITRAPLKILTDWVKNQLNK